MPTSPQYRLVRVPSLGVVDADLAYILYTSGSTGISEGRDAHASELPRLRRMGCTRSSAWLQTTVLSSHAPLHFDLSTFDLFAAALCRRLARARAYRRVRLPERRSGASSTSNGDHRLVLRPVDPDDAHAARRPGARARSRGSARSCFAGEVFPTKHLREPEARSCLTSASRTSSARPRPTSAPGGKCQRAPRGAAEAIPIGKAIANVDVFAGRRRAAGLPLRARSASSTSRGATVMQRYLGDPERTSSRLIPHPFPGALPDLVYRTATWSRSWRMATTTSSGATTRR